MDGQADAIINGAMAYAERTSPDDAMPVKEWLDDSAIKPRQPSLYHVGYAEIARNLCAQGATNADLADYFGVAISTISLWRIEKKEFFEACQAGAETAAPRVERALYERAMGYTFDSEEIKVIDGQVVRVPIRERVPPDYNSMRLWLCNRAPERWKDISHLDAGVAEDNPLAAWFKQFEGTAMRPQPRELPQPDPIEADYEVVAPPPRPKEDA